MMKFHSSTTVNGVSIIWSQNISPNRNNGILSKYSVFTLKNCLTSFLLLGLSPLVDRISDRSIRLVVTCDQYSTLQLFLAFRFITTCL